MFLEIFHKLYKVPGKRVLEVKLMNFFKILNSKWATLFRLLQPLTFTRLNDDNQNHQMNSPCPSWQLKALNNGIH